MNIYTIRQPCDTESFSTLVVLTPDVLVGRSQYFTYRFTLTFIYWISAGKNTDYHSITMTIIVRGGGHHVSMCEGSVCLCGRLRAPVVPVVVPSCEFGLLVARVLVARFSAFAALTIAADLHLQTRVCVIVYVFVWEGRKEGEWRGG